MTGHAPHDFCILKIKLGVVWVRIDNQKIIGVHNEGEWHCVIIFDFSPLVSWVLRPFFICSSPDGKFEVILIPILLEVQ